MCGICGFADLRGGTPAALLGARAQAMAAAIVHRGPDGAGVWIEERIGLAFGLGDRRSSTSRPREPSR